MDFNDNSRQLYADPNAYIQNWDYNAEMQKQNSGQNNKTQPNFFSQNIYPADNLCPPNFNFQPPNKQPNINHNQPNCKPLQHQQNCKNGQFYCQKPPQKVVFSEPYESVPNYYINNNFKKGNCACIPKPKPKCPPPKPPFSFDLKNILPLLSGLFKGGSGAGGFGNILSMLNQNSSGEQGGGAQGANLDFSSILKTLSNSGGLDGILNLFKPKNKNEKTQSSTFKTENSTFSFFKNNNSNFSESDTNKSSDFVIKNYSRVE